MSMIAPSKEENQVKRIVCLFSCGAASAVATKIALSDANGIPVVIHNNEIAEEHPDNKRFLSDCQTWFGHPINSMMNEKYHGSIYEVFWRNRFIKSRFGAPCTKYLKRELRDSQRIIGDQLILGFTCEEEGRLDRFIDANPDIDVRAPLIENGLTKADCLGIIQRAGIAIPAMYLLGYNNNNCIGCVKGGKGYWNKIRVDFPLVFQRMSDLQQMIGPGSYFFKGKEKGSPRVSLAMLKEDEGNYPTEPDISCGLFCEAAEKDFSD